MGGNVTFAQKAHEKQLLDFKDLCSEEERRNAKRGFYTETVGRGREKKNKTCEGRNSGDGRGRDSLKNQGKLFPNATFNAKKQGAGHFAGIQCVSEKKPE